MKLLHIGDEHWCAAQIEKCLASAHQIEEIALRISPELIVLSGDIQHKLLNVEEGSAYTEMMKHVQKLADIAPVIIIYGNESHDPAGSLEPIKLIQSAYPIYVSEYPETLALIKTSTGKSYFSQAPGAECLRIGQATRCIIHTLPYPSKEYLVREAAQENRIDDLNQLALRHLDMMMLGFAAKNIPTIPSVLVSHCNVAGAKLSSGQVVRGQDIYIPIQTLENSGADYIALGHIHLSQQIGENAYYAGGTYACNWGETEKKYINSVNIINRRQIEVEKIELSRSRPMVKHTATFTDGVVILNPEEPTDDWENAELRVTVTMSEDDKKAYKEKAIRDAYPGALSYKIETEVIYTEKTRSQEVVKATTLQDQFTAWADAVSKSPLVTPEVLAELHEIELAYHKANG